jgi:hypothetical protein
MIFFGKCDIKPNFLYSVAIFELLLGEQNIQALLQKFPRSICQSCGSNSVSPLFFDDF